MSSIADRLASTRIAIAEAAVKAGRAPDSVKLLAVSKTFPAEVIAEAVAAGQQAFGENRVQELQAKVPALPLQLDWHLIGPLQSNKVRKVLPLVSCIHSVHSIDIAKDINRIAGELQLQPKVCLEVNIGAETTKHGFTADTLKASITELLSLPNLSIQGLMCIPPFELEPSQTRPYFEALRKLRDELQTTTCRSFPELSMGMSHDFAEAIAEGATIVRVGSAIFGGR
jgi:PLP dependent protein